jgi:uncharacterized membrane protein
MDVRVVWIVLVSQLVVTAAFFLILPRITRRGLLFGVYVGEARWAGEEARAITRAWYRGMAAALAVSLAVGAVLAAAFPRTPAGALVSVFALLVFYLALYLRAYYQARRLAVPGAAPAAVAALLPDAPHAPLLPSLAIAIGAAGGVLAIAYTWIHYPDMPARVPTHFGISGRPDQWSARSFGSVTMLPFMTLVMGIGLGVIAWLTARAKRAYRANDRGVSVQAQLRFRRAWSRLLAAIAIITTAMLTSLSIASTRVAIGRAEALPVAFMLLTAVLLVFAIGGTLYLALRYGQGGARLESKAGDAPLADGLADNRRWLLGAFYVNRDDPSFFVEKRFGIGYTVNFGNPKAVALLVVFLLAIIGLSVVGILTARS